MEQPFEKVNFHNWNSILEEQTSLWHLFCLFQIRAILSSMQLWNLWFSSQFYRVSHSHGSGFFLPSSLIIFISQSFSHGPCLNLLSPLSPSDYAFYWYEFQLVSSTLYSLRTNCLPQNLIVIWPFYLPCQAIRFLLEVIQMEPTTFKAAI